MEIILRASPLDGWVGYTDLFFIPFISLVLTGLCWSRLLFGTENIPSDFWYGIPQQSESQITSREKRRRDEDLHRLFQEEKLDVAIFWGSQSGRAEQLAKRLAKSLKDNFALSTVAADPHEFKSSGLRDLQPTQICGFILSTYGDGDPPDNLDGLWNTVNEFNMTNTPLLNLRYMLFGLGNSNYRRYNQVAITVDAILQRLGAIRLGSAGYADEAVDNTEDAFLSWRQSTESQIQAKLGLTKRRHDYQPSFVIHTLPDQSSERVYHGEAHFSLLDTENNRNARTDAEIPRAVQIKRAKKLWESKERLCLHFDFDLGSNRLIKYKTGDHFAIWPSNPDGEVERLLTVLAIQERRDEVIKVEAVDKCRFQAVGVPTPTTIEALLRHYLEICGPLSKETVTSLIQFGPSEKSKEELRRLVSLNAFKREVSARHLTFTGLLEYSGFGSPWNLPMSFLLETLKPMQPRYYSISSSVVAEPRMVSITAVVDKPCKASGDSSTTAPGCYGLATTYLNALHYSMNNIEPSSPWPSFALNGPRGSLAGAKVFACVRRSPFKLPARPSTPIIMVGCGTGVAPFRAFVQERAKLRLAGQDVGPTLLFMGFRHPHEDFIYEGEWTEYGKILGSNNFKQWTAFSRERFDTKVYVQDLLRNNRDQILDLFDSHFGCRMYICGSAQMARDVVYTLCSLRAAIRRESEEEANVWVRGLRQSKQLQEDVWD